MIKYNFLEYNFREDFQLKRKASCITTSKKQVKNIIEWTKHYV